MQAVLKPFEGKRIVVTGGTGSMGQVLIRRLLTGEMGQPARIIVLSRDEAKQHYMRVEYQQRVAATDEIIYRNFQQSLTFWIGDVRDFGSVARVLREADVVINAAALKQVPTCEYFPFEAVRTNIEGAENIVRAIQEHSLPVETVVGVSTDKACKPVNTMGMTKAIQERIFIQANMRCPWTRFVCVRYGNVLASRGSVIPLFHEQIKAGGPVTITTTDMTRFLLSLDDAVDTVFAVVRNGGRGETFVPRAPAANIVDIANALIGDRRIEVRVTGIRPGEKIHEIMVSEEEAYRTVERGDYYGILPMLPEVLGEAQTWKPALHGEYSSANSVMSPDETREMLRSRSLLLDDDPSADPAKVQLAGAFHTGAAPGDLLR
jgi:UDP-glucose 4-epimerase